MIEQESKKQYLSAYLSHAGVAARRKAVLLIKTGHVCVNGEIVTQPGYVLQAGDRVTCDDVHVRTARKVYILFNKPAGYLSTAADEQGRETIFDILNLPKGLRVFSVGRLDCDTTGLLLMTNDGDLAQKLAHPRYNINKAYRAVLDRSVTLRDLEQLRNGVWLKDGFIKPDRVFVSGKNYRTVTVHIHSGKKRVVRRMFASLGYHVTALDRFAYAGLLKGRLAIGDWRYLTAQEVRMLRF